jgi:RNA-directed DNA polymerase
MAFNASRRATAEAFQRRGDHQRGVSARHCVPIPDQGKWLWYVVQGYFNYHAVPANARALHVFRHHVTDLWRRMLRRRSQKTRITWARMTELADFWLPKPIILHPWPSERFAVTNPRWEPYAGKPHVRICAGGVR